MTDYSREKKLLLQQAKNTVASSYSRLVHAGVLVLTGDDCSVVRIVFAKGNFAHLCGFEVFTTRDKTRHDRQERFYDYMIGNTMLPLNRIDFSDRHGSHQTSLQKCLRNTRQKIKIAPTAFDMLYSNLADKESYIVQSAKSAVAIFVGDTCWALGLKPKAMAGNGDVSEYAPVSLLSESVLSDRVHRAGSFAARIVAAEWR